MPSSIHRLATSEHFAVSHAYETVWLDRENGAKVTIGDFYGDPSVAVIDAQERWCAMGGVGLIIYFLDEPFCAYEYGKTTTQWGEYGRGKNDLWCVAAIEQTGPTSLLIQLDDGRTHTLSFHRTRIGTVEFTV
jgi:hypothetical protein